MACRGICIKYRFYKKTSKGGWYDAGARRCQICEMYVTTDSLFCPCCHYRLRLKPRNRAYRKEKATDTQDKPLECSVPTTPSSM